MKEHFDIYIIKNTRSKNEIISFNKKFLVNYKELASEYEIPQYSETPNKVLKTAEELLSYCEENISEHCHLLEKYSKLSYV